MISLHILTLLAATQTCLATELVPLSRTTKTECKPRPTGSGPFLDPDTPHEFWHSPAISRLAQSAPPPRGYTSTFTNLHACSTADTPDAYLGYVPLDGYNTTKCATLCDATERCLGFNIFIERSPTAESGPRCPSRPSTSLIKCSLWASPTALIRENARNAGYMDHEFTVVIAGSNGYVRKGSLGSVGNGFAQGTWRVSENALDSLSSRVSGAAFRNVHSPLRLWLLFLPLWLLLACYDHWE
jgi:hypothetical protein